jgi:hypothetical protein
MAPAVAAICQLNITYWELPKLDVFVALEPGESALSTYDSASQPSLDWQLQRNRCEKM